MAYKYEIRQQVETINKKWLVPIYETQSERISELEYERIVNDNPGKYFELVFIDVTEDCIKFTPITDGV